MTLGNLGLLSQNPYLKPNNASKSVLLALDKVILENGLLNSISELLTLPNA